MKLRKKLIEARSSNPEDNQGNNQNYGNQPEFKMEDKIQDKAENDKNNKPYAADGITTRGRI